MKTRIAISIIMRFLLLPIFLNFNTSLAANFYEQRYRGWLWFEDKEVSKDKEKELQEQQKKKKFAADVAKARREIEAFSKELDDLKVMAIRYPENVEYQRAWKKKTAEMMNIALAMHDGSDMANFIDPQIADRISNPMNLYGRKIKEKVDEKEQQEAIKGLASDVELFVFIQSGCDYCTQLEPVLADFANRYGFSVEAVSLNGGKSEHFKTHDNPALAQVLDIKEVPTVVLVTKDSKISFELIRGAVSISELEENSLLAIKNLKTLKPKQAKLEREKSSRESSVRSSSQD